MPKSVKKKVMAKSVVKAPTHFVQVGKLWVGDDGKIGGIISLGLLGEVPFTAHPDQFGKPGQRNMIVAGDRTPFGMIQTLLANHQAKASYDAAPTETDDGMPIDDEVPF